jgi:hypothetical protein
MEIVESMDQVPGADVVEVDLPRELAPPPRSNTLQQPLHPPVTPARSEHERPIRVASLPGARLLGSGGVATSEGRLVWESLWDKDHFGRDFDPPPVFPPPTQIPGVSASIVSLWCDNYFHWIFNSLPRLAVLKASGVQYEHLIVPEDMKPFQYETLDLLGVPRDILVPFTGAHVQPEVLVWASPVAPINDPSAFLLDWVRSSLSAPNPKHPRRRLYVSRKGASRNVINERELYKALEPLGFEYVEPGSLPFPEQVQVFTQAQVAVGSHGANFVNGIFSPHMTVVEFFQPAHVNWSICGVLSGVGHEHWNILCQPVRRIGRRRFDDMRVPVDLVLATLKAIGV